MRFRRDADDPAAPRRPAGGVRRRLRLRVDPIACTGHGICWELVPELIRPDDWGFPVIDGEAIPPSLMVEVRRAIAACPVLALRLEQTPVGAPAR